MADVFISYSQRLPEPTEALAADLGARGYAYWYDTRLLPSDVFWRVIMKRIIDAKAVIVIWSPPAVDSEWVYGEAKLAHELKKLVCLRTDDVSPAAVPLPFNGYNVSPVADRPRIFASLEQLGVPVGAVGGFRAPVGDPVLAAPALAAADRASGEIALAWAEIKDSDDPEDFEVFLRHYGQEHQFFARMAEKRRARLRGLSLPVVPPPALEAGRVVAIATAAKTEVAALADDVQLRIEAGMHTAGIRRISLSADGRMMATGSDDKTVRLWALPEGRLVRTLRPPIGPGNDGKVFAVALAPDGSWVAAGGWGQSGGRHYVSIFDIATGAVTARLGPLPNVIGDLKVSPDGTRLAAGLGGKNGIRVWHVSTPPHGEGSGVSGGRVSAPGAALSSVPATPSLTPPRQGEGNGWRLAFEDTDYGGDVYGLAFGRDGRLWATSSDGYVRVYGTDGTRRVKVKAPGGARPIGVAVSPDGARIAVGSEDSTRVDVLDAATLAPVFAADRAGVSGGNLCKVAWLSDGRLAAAGTHGRGSSPIFVWADGGRGARVAWPGPADAAMDLAAVPAGLGAGVAFGGGDPAFGLAGADGARRLWRGSPLADLRGKRFEHFLASEDGRRVWFGLNEWSAAPHLLDLEAIASGGGTPPTPDPSPRGGGEAKTAALHDAGPLPRGGPSLAPGTSSRGGAARGGGESVLVPSSTAPGDLRSADTAGLKVAGWINSTAPTLAGTPLPLKTYETARSLAVAPDAGSFVLGTEWWLRRFDAAGTSMWEQPVPGVVWGVNLAQEGRLVIAAYGDGTIRWHRTEDGAELLAFFVLVDRDGGSTVAKDWVLWTPKGYYTCSPGGDALIGWHVNRGPDQAADFYPAETFAATFKRPDIVAAALDGV